MFLLFQHMMSFYLLDHNEASVLLLRSCQWSGKNILNWDADLIPETDEHSK